METRIGTEGHFGFPQTLGIESLKQSAVKLNPSEISTQYGIANMYAAMGLLHGGDFNVFREEGAALKWLTGKN